ncbi:hypothetical protein SAMN02910291_02771 [Desulfovibrio desulfuricans]|uniref:HTH-like domain-containing protein n=1 Tax=Desulfovibrio desulfuricans TaxID=876 RepID=A0AA94HV99_DESDE|nr:hypothetical protein SAMN02910291_02771 [Desulfovibrio desulfuricans]SPD36260.1 Hypothetical protein DSVG11_2173 [Desulfovibrio sp. G11]
METIRKIRLALSKGMSIREAATKFTKSRNTIRKILRSGATSFVYQRKEQLYPALGSYIESLEALLAIGTAYLAPTPTKACNGACMPTSFAFTLMEDLSPNTNGVSDGMKPSVRQMRDYLVLLGYSVGRKRVRRLMRLMGLMAVYQKPKTSIPHQRIRATRISCGDCPSPDPIRSGARISRTSPCAKDFCTWWPLWTGTVKRCCPGDFPTPWTRIFVSRPWKKPWRTRANPIFSTPTKAANSSASRSPMSCGRTVSTFPWMAVAAGWTMSSSNSSGARSSMNACICTLLKPAPKLVPESADGSTFTIGSGLTVAWEACLRTLTTNKGL